MHPSARWLLVTLLAACSSRESAPASASVDAGGDDAATALADAAPLADGGVDAPADVAADRALDAGPDAAPFLAIDTRQGIRAFLTFDGKVSDVPAAAGHDVFVWGGSEWNVPTYHASNPGIVVSMYLPFTRDPAPAHDLAYWQSAHPDWVLYKCDRTTPAYEFGDPYVPLDISNPAVIDWQMQTYVEPAAKQGYDAVAADNFVTDNVFGACGVFAGGVWTSLYSGEAKDAKYAADTIHWLASMRQRMHALSPRPLALVPNYSSSASPETDTVLQGVVANVDGILDERGFTVYGAGYPSVDEWLGLQKVIEYVQAQGKAYFSLNEFGAAVDDAALSWALASYLMSKESQSALFVSGVQEYGADNWHPEYGAAIGTPCGPMAASQGAWVREFQHAIAVANPSASAVSYALPAGSYTTLSGQSAPTTLSLPPHTGMVVLAVSGARC